MAIKVKKPLLADLMFVVLRSGIEIENTKTFSDAFKRLATTADLCATK